MILEHDEHWVATDKQDFQPSKWIACTGQILWVEPFKPGVYRVHLRIDYEHHSELRVVYTALRLLPRDTNVRKQLTI